MDPTTVVVVIVAVVVVLAAAFLLYRSRRRASLQERFGPEYERAVAEHGSKPRAEADLEARARRRRTLDIRPLTPDARQRHAQRWRDTQARFVDDPGPAVAEADQLVQQVMRERNYPVDDFEQRADDLSVDHPEVVSDYQAAHAISLAHDHGHATTEDLRQALVHYRQLFARLLEQPDADSDTQQRTEVRDGRA